MKPNSVIVDMAAEMGGNCELTKPGQKFVDHSGVIILGYTDLASRMAQQASDLFAVNMLNLLEIMCVIEKIKTNNASNYQIDYEDDIIKGLTVVKSGEYVYVPPGQAPPPPPPADQKPKEADPKANGGAKIKDKEVVIELQEKSSGDSHKKGHGHGAAEVMSESPFKDAVIVLFVLLILFEGIGAFTWTGDGQYTLLTQIFIFILAIIIGYMVIWGVTPALHTPLMSVTNAISGIIVVGCMLQLPSPGDFGATWAIIGLFGVFFASINIFGGFYITRRMLGMFKK